MLPADRLDQIPFDDLRVIDIVENLHEGAAHFADDLKGLRCSVQIVVGVIVAFRVQRLHRRQRVDDFHDHRDIVGSYDLARALQSPRRRSRAAALGKAQPL